MHFEEWNELIAKELFNDGKKSQNILLCLTKVDIINIYKQKKDDGKNEVDIWKDFCTTIIEEGTSRGRRKSFLDKFKDAIEQQKDDKSSYPYYISYLIFLTLPLVEEDYEEVRFKQNAYYPKLKSFLKKNSIKNFKEDLKDFDKIVTPCWKKLACWANITKKGDWGFFYDIIRNGQREHVDRIFSQVILTPILRKKLPNIFKNGRPAFGDLTLFQNQFYDILRIDKKSDFLWNIALGLIQMEYEKYMDTPDYITDAAKTKTDLKPKYEEFLQMNIIRNSGKVIFRYREKTQYGYSHEKELYAKFRFKPIYFFMPCHCIDIFIQ